MKTHTKEELYNLFNLGQITDEQLEQLARMTCSEGNYEAVLKVLRAGQTKVRAFYAGLN